MTALHALLLGILEGATEFLPISSTGHLILASHLLKIPETPFITSFIIAIQLGAIAAVVVMYWRTLIKIETIKKLVVAFLPTAVIGLALYPVAKHLLESPTVVVMALLIGGVVLIAIELVVKRRIEDEGSAGDVTYRQAFMLGLFQSLAIIPGVSRSGASIAGGLLLGMRRLAVVEFSFLLAVPTMAAATGLDLLKSYKDFASGDFGLLAIGMVSAFTVAYLSLKFLLQFARRYTFIPFGIYRILLAILFLLFIL
jgi:undecaprenyl-diphosphatase